MSLELRDIFAELGPGGPPKRAAGPPPEGDVPAGCGLALG